MIGYCYENGYGVAKILSKAISQYELALDDIAIGEYAKRMLAILQYNKHAARAQAFHLDNAFYVQIG